MKPWFRVHSLPLAKGAPEDLFIKDSILKLAMLIWLLMNGGGIYVFS